MIEKLLIETPDSNNGLANIEGIVTTDLLGGYPVFMSLKNEYLHLVGRCFDDSPLSAIEVSRWPKLDSLLSQCIQKITGSRSTPVIGNID